MYIQNRLISKKTQAPFSRTHTVPIRPVRLLPGAKQNEDSATDLRWRDKLNFLSQMQRSLLHFCHLFLRFRDALIVSSGHYGPICPLSAEQVEIPENMLP
jgi:hypothetical protein